MEGRSQGWKAFYHFWMMRMYGPIPIIKENIPVSAGEDEVRVVRDKIDDIVTYIVSLIDESVEYLPRIFRTKQQKWTNNSSGC